MRIHLLQELYDLADMAVINEVIDSRAFSEFCGVDSSIIAVPSSTKNREKRRDEDAFQAKKGNQWYLGYKAHIGVDKDSGLLHHVEVTAANMHDVTAVPKLWHRDEESIHRDSGWDLVQISVKMPSPTTVRVRKSSIRSIVGRLRVKTTLHVPKGRSKGVNGRRRQSVQISSMFSAL